MSARVVFRFKGKTLAAGNLCDCGVPAVGAKVDFRHDPWGYRVARVMTFVMTGYGDDLLVEANTHVYLRRMKIVTRAELAACTKAGATARSAGLPASECPPFTKAQAIRRKAWMEGWHEVEGKKYVARMIKEIQAIKPEAPC